MRFLLDPQAEGTSSSATSETASASPAAVSDATPTFDRAAAETRVSERLASVFGDEPKNDDAAIGEEVTTEEAGTEQTTTDETETPSEETTETEEEVTDENKEAAVTPPAKKDGNAPTLPPAFVRSLKAYEWTDEEIAANLKAFGPKFIETAAKIHANRSAEIANWANAGRAARNARQSDQNGQQEEQLQTLPAIDVKPLKEKYGEDALIEELVNPINNAIKYINAILPQVQAVQQNSQRAELETLSQQIESFFGSKEMQPYAEVYGTAARELTPPQIEQRNKVLEMADALLAGAKMQGRWLSLDDVMKMAFDSFSGNMKASAARKQIVSTVQKRAKGLTLKPSARKSAPTSTNKDGSFNRAALEAKVGAMLKKL